MNNVQKFEYCTNIKENHLDVFGHVNNTAYMILFEEARWDFITPNNFGLEKIKELQIGPVVLEANIKYKRELKNRDQIKVISETKSVDGKIMLLSQIIYKDDGKISCIGDFTIGLFDMKNRKLISPTLDWLKAIGVSQ